jgi:phosphohistidine swiveling domain-containing protein
LEKAIAQVIASYDSPNAADQVLVQPMLHDIAVSGVVFTRDIDTLAPYYVFNYDARSHRTDTVTSGSAADLKTLIHSRFSPVEISDVLIRKVHHAVQELEHLCECDRLDVEFAVTCSEEVYIFQVRPLVAPLIAQTPSDLEIQAYLHQIHDQIAEISKPHPYLHGSRSIYGVMPDWNPAEIIGVKPRRLALTLYKELVTDTIWAYQRNNYGYRNLRSFPLLLSFGGLPYIDVRVDFNSFIPADLDEELANRLVNFYVEKLISLPHSHDKIEFDIVFSCYTLDLPERLESLLQDGFTYWDLGELRSSLRRLTNRIIDPLSGLYTVDYAKIHKLLERQSQILTSDLSHISKIYWLLEDCKRYGTLPFAGLARAAFIAVQFLQSFKALGILSASEYDAFLKTINSVAKGLSQDVGRLRRGELSRDRFLQHYGHLRPGTYDLLSSRYDEAFDRYFAINWESTIASEAETTGEFSFSSDQLQQISALLKQHGITVEAEGLIQFIRQAIEGREYAKFVFSKSLSDALQLISQLGNGLGFSDDALSYLDIATLQKCHASMPVPDLYTVLEQDIAIGQRQYKLTSQLKLPPLICAAIDIYSFYLEDGSPNYITLSRVIAEVVEGIGITKDSCTGKIVMIENADPGYDWLFSNQIAGLITMYGGANSHMAIRASELGIPAVIGCGEKLYRAWSKAKLLEIDAANKQVRTIHT